MIKQVSAPSHIKIRSILMANPLRNRPEILASYFNCSSFLQTSTLFQSYNSLCQRDVILQPMARLIRHNRFCPHWDLYTIFLNDKNFSLLPEGISVHLLFCFLCCSAVQYNHSDLRIFPMIDFVLTPKCTMGNNKTSPFRMCCPEKFYPTFVQIYSFSRASYRNISAYPICLVRSQPLTNHMSMFHIENAL